MIAHRLSTIVDADRIVVLDAGGGAASAGTPSCSGAARPTGAWSQAQAARRLAPVTPGGLRRCCKDLAELRENATGTMLGKRLLWRSGGMLVCALLVAACEAYDPKLLRIENPDKPPPPDSGMPPSRKRRRRPEDDAGKPCVERDEICNGLDDDCDGKIDEDTQKYCESVIQNAVTTCASQALLCVKYRVSRGLCRLRRQAAERLREAVLRV